MKKLVFAMPQLSGGGAERVAAALCGEMSRMEGCEIHLLTYTRNPETDYPVDGNIIWHSMEGEESSLFRRVFGKISYLRKTIRQIGPDCVISLAGPAMITLLTVAMWGSGVPLILSERNDPRNYPRPRHLRILRSWAYSRSNAMVFQTREAMEFFSPAVQKKGTVISNPLTGNLPEPYSGVREPRIVTSCRLNPQKNLDLLIDAFSDIAEAFPQYTLDIYGEGGEKERLLAKIREMGLEQRVTLRGYSSHIYEDIGKAALFVSSSDYEGISNSMLEAIALGIPAVCTDCPVGGARETIDHGVNGLLVPVGDRKKLAEAMTRVLSDQAFADRLGQEGSLLREKISVRAIAQQWMDVIEQTAG